MSRFSRAWSCAAGILLALIASGCFPSGDSPLDEQKEPHFLAGKNLATQMDFQGAIDSFEKALDVNPHSASAHFELACLYESKAQPPDFAAAVYHYDRFLKLFPKSEMAEVVKTRINSCKMELAKTVSAFSPWPAQHDMENLMLENKNLKAQLAQYQSQAASASRAPTPVVSPVQPVVPTRVAPASLQAETSRTAAPAVSSNRTAAATAIRTHIVKAHEYPAIIAKEYGISIAALMAANPQMRPTHLQVGQTLNIPAP